MLGSPSRADVEALEEAGADSLWVGGHVASPNPGPEAVISLAQLAGMTTRATVGTAVLLLPLYPPAIVAKQVAELDRLTGGRVVLGVGVGGEYPAEFTACQVPSSERGRRADESIGLLHALWKGDAVTHNGPFYPMAGVRIHPSPVQAGGPPILVAGRKGKSVRRAATLGDGWIPYQCSPRAYDASVREIREHATSAGRDLDGYVWALWTYINIDADGHRARRETVELMKRYGQVHDDRIVDHVTVSGTPSEARRRLHEFVDAGVDHFVFAVIGAAGNRQRLLIQEEVVPDLIGAPDDDA